MARRTFASAIGDAFPCQRRPRRLVGAGNSDAIALRSDQGIIVKSRSIIMVPNPTRLLSAGVAAALISACSGGGSGSGAMGTPAPSPPAAQTGSVSMLLSDASTEDWCTIGVKVLSIALVPQGGGGNVNVYTA